LVAVDRLIGQHANPEFGHQAFQLRLAIGERFAAPILAIELDQIEGIEKRALIAATIVEQVERWDAILVAYDGLAVDGAGRQPRHRFGDQRITLAQVVAGAVVEPHPAIVLAGNDPDPVVLHLMQPKRPGWRAWGLHRQTGRYEARLQREGAWLRRSTLRGSLRYVLQNREGRIRSVGHTAQERNQITLRLGHTGQVGTVVQLGGGIYIPPGDSVNCRGGQVGWTGQEISWP